MAGTNGELNDQRLEGRVWKRFLSAQDQAHVRAGAIGRPRKVKGFGQRPALLLIDLYRSVFGDQPEPLLESIKTWPGSCGLAGWEALPHIQRLLAAARAAGIPVIHTRGSGDPNLGGRSRKPRLDADRQRRGGEIIDDVAPLTGELVIRKASASAYWGTPLVGHLIDHGIDTVIVGGESTSGCVRASVVDGDANHFRMIVVEECVFDRHEAPHAIELFSMNEKYADVITLSEALTYLQRFMPTSASTTGERALAEATP